MKLLVLDFETFFDGSYSLKRGYTTEAYVRDPRFKAHLLAYWIPGDMPAPANCTDAWLHNDASFRALVSSSAVLCQHAHFDGLILSHHYGLKPAYWLDILPMARLVLPKLKSHSLDALAAHFGLPAKNVPYNLFRGVRDLSSVPGLYGQVAEGAEHDAWLTHSIFQKLLPYVPREELDVIDCTIRMFTEPCLELDRPRMEAFLQAEKVRKAKAMLAAGMVFGIKPPTTVDELKLALADIEAELQSSAKFQQALEAIGYPCPMKWSEKQQCEIPALAKNDDGMQELLEHDDPRIQALAAARLGVKSTIDETRAARLLEAQARGALPVYLSYAAAKTLRFGGGDKTNWQNFRRGGEIRKSVVAPRGSKLVVGDLSQIEYRLLLWLTGQLDKLQALASGVDLYCEFATEFYGETITKADKPRRGVGKQGILMGGYGAGKDTMIRTAVGGGYGPPVYMTDAEGQRMVDIYRGGHPRVLEFWRWCDSLLPILASGGTTQYRDVLHIEDRRIWLPNDTAIDYTGLRWACNTDVFPDQEPDGEGYAWWESNRKGWARVWGSKVTADIIQSLACVIIKSTLVKISKRLKVVLQVHDEIVCAVPDADAEGALTWMLDVLRTPPAWCHDIPLEAEGIVSERYDK